VEESEELNDLPGHVAQVAARLEHGQRIAVTNGGKLLGPR
jgi:hypothetical protein